MSDSNPSDGQLEKKQEEVKRGVFHSLKAWGDSSLPPALLATLIFPLHARPLQLLPSIFPPILLFSSYVNLAGFPRDAAGMSAAWSGLYLLLASRRKFRVTQKFTPRGFVRGGALALAAGNAVAGGVAFAFGEKGRAGTWIGMPKDGE